MGSESTRLPPAEVRRMLAALARAHKTMSGGIRRRCTHAWEEIIPDEAGPEWYCRACGKLSRTEPKPAKKGAKR